MLNAHHFGVAVGVHCFNLVVVVVVVVVVVAAVVAVVVFVVVVVVVTDLNILLYFKFRN
jgi:hypothetical protein